MQQLRHTEEKTIMKARFTALLAGFCLVVGLPLAAMAGPTPGGTSTADGDGVEDAFDNCTSSGNASQKDSDHDGCGNTCDGDFDQTGTTGGPDFLALKAAFGATTGQPAYNAAIDMTCDGAIGGPDFLAFKAEFATTPGPSGVLNKVSPACP
jgi:hypothetical protein